MTDYRTLAGQTVDGYYYLTNDDGIKPGDEWRTYAFSDWSIEENKYVFGETVQHERRRVENETLVYRRPAATPQPAQPCSRCEELEAVIRAADEMRLEMSARVERSRKYGNDSHIQAFDNYHRARSKVKIGGEQ